MTNPANPITKKWHDHDGETIRDKDARAAMQALIAAGYERCDAAREAFWLADRMEEERNKHD